MSHLISQQENCSARHAEKNWVLRVVYSSLSNHVKSTKHQDGKRSLQKKEIRERDIAKQFSDYNEQNHLIGETLPEATQVFRVKVSKIEHFRELFEEGGYRLTDRRHIFDLIPFIQKQEIKNLRKEISGNKLIYSNI